MKCPKCGAESVLTHEHRPEVYPYRDHATGETIFPSLDDIIAARKLSFFGVEYEKVYECSTHGEYGIREDGTAEFETPDAWVVGPNGEKLFRT